MLTGENYFCDCRVVGTEIQFSPNHNAIQMLPLARQPGTFYQIMAIPEKHTSPVTARGNFIHVIGKLIESVANPESNIL